MAAANAFRTEYVICVVVFAAIDIVPSAVPTLTRLAGPMVATLKRQCGPQHVSMSAAADIQASEWHPDG